MAGVNPLRHGKDNMTVYLQFLFWYMLGPVDEYTIDILCELRPLQRCNVPLWVD